MIEKYEGMTAERLARTLTPPMRTALLESVNSGYVTAPANTSRALIDRGLISAGWTHPVTESGRDVIALLWPEQADTSAQREAPVAARPIDAPRKLSASPADALRAAMTSVLDGWISGAKSNHDANNHRVEFSSCWETFHADDIRRMIDDAARDIAAREGQQ